MANITLSAKSHDDYRASLFFNSLKIADAKFTKALKNFTRDGVTEVIPCIHVEGTQTTSGLMVNFDIWPRNHATAEDIKAMPDTIGDFVFRIGYWETYDENGEKKTVPSQPKLLGYYNGSTLVKFSGEKRVFEEDPVDNSAE